MEMRTRDLTVESTHVMVLEKPRQEILGRISWQFS